MRYRVYPVFSGCYKVQKSHFGLFWSTCRKNVGVGWDYEAVYEDITFPTPREAEEFILRLIDPTPMEIFRKNNLPYEYPRKIRTTKDFCIDGKTYSN